MCHQIDSSVLIVNILKNRQNCSIKELIKIKESLENSIPNIYINISDNSIYSTIENHPRMLKWDNFNIEKVIDSDDFFEQEFVDRCFNVDIDEPIRSKVIRILNESVEV